MFGTYVLWPGASRTLYFRFSVSKNPRPTSTVLPLDLSSFVRSKTHERYHDGLPWEDN